MPENKTSFNNIRKSFSPESPIAFPETENYFLIGSLLYYKEEGILKEYLVNRTAYSECEIIEKKSISGEKQLKTIFADDIGRKVFFRKEDSNFSIEALSKNSLYSNYFSEVDIKNRLATLMTEAKEFEPDEYLSNEKKAQLIETYHNIEYSLKEEKLFRESCQSDCFARMDFDTKLSSSKDEYIGNYYIKIYVSKNPKYEVKDVYDETIWQIEAGLYSRDVSPYHAGVNLSSYKDSGIVVDWRSPIAGLYDEREKTVFEKETKGFKYIHSLMLKRRLLSNGNITNLFIVGGNDNKTVGSFDPFLASILEERKGSHKLQDIIESIQQNQNEIIRKIPINKDIVVQGCAGSGKTMVLLHRLSVLIYNNPDISSSNYDIITPSKLFDSHISELAEQINIDKVRRRTPQELYFDILGAYDEAFLKQEVAVSDSLSDEATTRYIYSDAFINDLEANINIVQENIADEIIKECNLSFFIELTEKYSFDVSIPYIRNSEDKKSILEKFISFQQIVISKFQELSNFSSEYIYLYSKYQKEKELISSFFDTPKGTLSSFLKDDLLTKTDLLWISSYLSEYKQKKLFKQQLSRGILEPVLTDKYSIRLTPQTQLVDVNRILYSLGIDKESLQKDFCNREIDSLSGQTTNFRKQVRNLQERVINKGYQWSAIRKYIENSGKEDFSAAQEVLSLSKKLQVHPKLRQHFETLYGKLLESKFGMLADNAVYRCKLYAEVLFCERYYSTSSLLERPQKLNDALGKYVFFDEGQDISLNEYKLICSIFPDRIFNIFGDTNQLIKDGYGINDWTYLKQIRKNYLYHELNENYRNTQNITVFCNNVLGRKDVPIGPNGNNVVYIEKEDEAFSQIESAVNIQQSDRIAVIVRSYEDYFAQKCFNALNEKLIVNSIQSGKISLLTVEASKGLEFDHVFVADKNMSSNERYIAYTRALSELTVIRVKNQFSVFQ